LSGREDEFDEADLDLADFDLADFLMMPNDDVVELDDVEFLNGYISLPGAGGLGGRPLRILDWASSS
jgi:hypothetical protein